MIIIHSQSFIYYLLLLFGFESESDYSFPTYKSIELKELGFYLFQTSYFIFLP